MFENGFKKFHFAIIIFRFKGQNILRNLKSKIGENREIAIQSVFLVRKKIEIFWKLWKMRLYWVIFHHCDQITGIELALWILKKSVARIGSLTKDLLKSREERNYRRISGKNSSFWAASQGRKGEFSWRGGGGGDRDSPRDRPTWKTSFTPPAELHNCVFQTHHQWKSSLNFLMHYGTRKKNETCLIFFSNEQS